MPELPEVFFGLRVISKPDNSVQRVDHQTRYRLNVHTILPTVDYSLSFFTTTLLKTQRSRNFFCGAVYAMTSTNALEPLEHHRMCGIIDVVI